MTMKNFTLLVAAISLLTLGASSAYAHCGKCDEDKSPMSTNLTIKNKSNWAKDASSQREVGSGCCKDKGSSSTVELGGK
jgi:hypothetical protein